MQLPTAADNMNKFLTEWEARFTGTTVVRTLMNLPPRRTVSLADLTVVEEQRKGYSYGSRGLLELLDILAPDLGSVGLADFLSRLVYLTSPQKI